MRRRKEAHQAARQDKTIRVGSARFVPRCCQTSKLEIDDRSSIAVKGSALPPVRAGDD
ncbi:hypothetical protein [Chamaesiphon minutus]|uniref:hypothetical protein n=1 Tax=Chamaesiphon minutus TaxID=1173032 RepID=UPI0012FC5DAD|nr:hypothetical protein [Chamaesiphon minutus]